MLTSRASLDAVSSSTTSASVANVNVAARTVCGTYDLPYRTHWFVSKGSNHVSPFGAPLAGSVPRLLDTAAVWFGEGDRTGTYRVRTVAEAVEASRPWRARIAAIGGQAFVFEPAVAEAFADVNSSGTLDEERDDLVTLNALVEQHRARLEPHGLTAALVAQGLTLQREAEGRDLAGVLGLRSRDEALALRNRLATYVVALAREARVAGINGSFDDQAARALRVRLVPRRPAPPAQPSPPEGRRRRGRRSAGAPVGGGDKPNG